MHGPDPHGSVSVQDENIGNLAAGQGYSGTVPGAAILCAAVFAVAVQTGLFLGAPLAAVCAAPAAGAIAGAAAWLCSGRRFGCLLFCCSVTAAAAAGTASRCISPKAAHALLIAARSAAPSARGPGQLKKKGLLQGIVQSKAERRRPGEVRFIVTGSFEHAAGRFLISAPDPPWQTPPAEGQSVVMPAVLQPVYSNSGLPPALLSYEGFLYRRRITGFGRAAAAQPGPGASADSPRDAFIGRLQLQHGQSDELSALLASTIGARDLLGDALLAVFRETGTTHLLVISGFHISTIFFLLYRVSCFLLSRSETLLLLMPICLPASAIAFAGAAGFTFLSGAEIPAVRSLLVLAVFAGAAVGARRARPLRTLLLAFAMIQFVWPGSCWEPGCQLTFAAVLGLIMSGHASALLVPPPNALELRLKRRLKLKESFKQTAMRRLLKALLVCVFAWLYTLPVQLYWFESFSPLAPLYNLLLIAPFSAAFICMGSIAIAASFLHLPGAAAITAGVLKLCSWFLCLMRLLARAGRWSGIGMIELEHSSGVYAAAAAGLVICLSLLLFLTVKKKGAEAHLLAEQS